MNVEEFRDYCLSLPGVTEKMPLYDEIYNRKCRDYWQQLEADICRA